MTEQSPIGLSVQDAADMLNKEPRAVLVDIRSTMEYLFVGHPAGAVHIAWIDEPDWDINPQFVTEIRKLMLGGVSANEDSAPIVLICRSGKRSVEAGKALIESGLSNIYHVEEGFEGERDDDHHRSTTGGWRFRGMPWEQC